MLEIPVVSVWKEGTMKSSVAPFKNWRGGGEGGGGGRDGRRRLVWQAASRGRLALGVYPDRVRYIYMYVVSGAARW